jgi:hypothetical protein
MQLSYCNALAQLVRGAGKEMVMKESYKFRLDAFQLFNISRLNGIPNKRDML